MDLALSRNFEEFSGIDANLFENFVNRAQVKLRFESFIGSYDQGRRSRHYSNIIFWFWSFLEFSGIFRNFQSQDTVADINIRNF